MKALVDQIDDNNIRLLQINYSFLKAAAKRKPVEKMKEGEL
jgi:hypothetical protein